MVFCGLLRCVVFYDLWFFTVYCGLQFFAICGYGLCGLLRFVVFCGCGMRLRYAAVVRDCYMRLRFRGDNGGDGSGSDNQLLVENFLLASCTSNAFSPLLVLRSVHLPDVKSHAPRYPLYPLRVSWLEYINIQKNVTILIIKCVK